MHVSRHYLCVRYHESKGKNNCRGANFLSVCEWECVCLLTTQHVLGIPSSMQALTCGPLPAMHTDHKLIASLFSLPGKCHGLQHWQEQPRYTEVNPTGQVVMTCRIDGKQGECRWEKDGSPIGIYPGKYEWAAQPEKGDCSLRILNSSLEFDDGVWQCQVTPSSFNSKDALISEGARLVVRGKEQYQMVRSWGI